MPIKRATKKASVTPKDFFFYLTMAAALYISAVALIGLWFSYISYLFPDALSYYYAGDFAGSGARGFMATLIVAFPIFLVFARLVNQDIRKTSDKGDLWIRKWLLYLTLFVAGGTLAVDVVVLLNAFLGGELSTQFVLKILTVFLVAAGVFGYFIADIRGVWEKKEKESLIYGGITAFIVLLSVILGFVFFGSPQTQRLYRLDQDKIYDLQNLQWQIVDYWQNKDELPEDLTLLRDSLRGIDVPLSPETGEAYRYEVTGELSFNLCADFNLPSREVRGDGSTVPEYMRDGFGAEGANWEHDAGDHCFERTIDPDFFQRPGA